MNDAIDPDTPAIAMVFPGQGSQSVGMLSLLAGPFPQVEETFEEASDVLGYDLWELVGQGPAEELDQTDRTQPAMLAAGVAVWRVWAGEGGAVPALLAGHSLGEYTALVCAGALGYPEAVSLVAARGRCMQEAVAAGAGAMAAVLGLSDAAVVEVCNLAAEGEVVSAVNYNSPGQVVIAGHSDAVQRAMSLAQERGAKRVVRLPVSVPSHCALMKPAVECFAARLEGAVFHRSQIPVIRNVDASTHEDPDDIRAALNRQLYSPVQWVRTIETIRNAGITRIIEAGPGKVLAGLCKRIDKSLQALPVYDPDTLAATLHG
ncbi:MAG: ACP S-malonyltransferase [Gammaproteobacteria bacterium]|jgi:[acyl-carrier-protein] S-malonyltransferase